MEERKTIINYMEQVLTTFGMIVIMLIALGEFFGERARDISGLFRLGAEGLSTETLLQFLVISMLETLLQFIFFTDNLIRQMSIVRRTMGMLLSTVGVVIVMNLLCGWFPVNMWEPWALFVFCFGICFVVSVGVMSAKEKMENRKMEEALEKLKRKEVYTKKSNGGEKL